MAWPAATCLFVCFCLFILLSHALQVGLILGIWRSVGGIKHITFKVFTGESNAILVLGSWVGVRRLSTLTYS